jgi:hypothetical protein
MRRCARQVCISGSGMKSEHGAGMLIAPLHLPVFLIDRRLMFRHFPRHSSRWLFHRARRHEIETRIPRAPGPASLRGRRDGGLCARTRLHGYRPAEMGPSFCVRRCREAESDDQIWSRDGRERESRAPIRLCEAREAESDGQIWFHGCRAAESGHQIADREGREAESRANFPDRDTREAKSDGQF